MKKEVVKVQDALGLIEVTKDLLTKGMGSEELYALVDIKLKLDKFAEGFETFREEVSTQTKPDDLKEGEDPTEEQQRKWNKKVSPLIQKKMEEDSGISSIRILTKESFHKINKANEKLTLSQSAFLYSHLVK